MSGVRDAARRGEKYNAKLDGTIIGQRFTALKSTMQAQTGVQFPLLASMENEIKSTVLEPLGISTVMFPAYLNFARECYSRANRFSDLTLKNEAQTLKAKWYARGLTSSVLVSIASTFGISIT